MLGLDAGRHNLACAIQCSRSTLPGNASSWPTQIASSGVQSAIWRNWVMPSALQAFSFRGPMPLIS